MEWQTVNTVPRGRDVEIAVIDSEGVVAVAHPCRLTESGTPYALARFVA